MAEIGRRAEAMRLDPSVACDCSMTAWTVCEEGRYPGLHRLGLRIVERLEAELAEIVGSERRSDAADRARLLCASRLDGMHWTGEVAAAITAGFGIAPSVALPIACVLWLRGASERWATIADATDTETTGVISRMADSACPSRVDEPFDKQPPDPKQH